MSKLFRSLAAVLGIALSVLVIPSTASAGIGNSATPTFPAIVTVGQTGIAASVTFTNQNTPTNTTDTNNVCNNGDPGPCPAGDPGITLIASCAAYGSFSTCATFDPDVFDISNTATGQAGTACAGWAFAVELSDAASGRVRFTPTGAFAGQQVMLGGTGASCTIDFTFDVTRMPAIDALAAPGVQTLQITDNSQYSVQAGIPSSARGTSAGITVNKATPTLVTTATPTAVLGSGAIRDSVSVTGQATPAGTATVTFRAYGPSDATCTGTPAFTGAPIAYPTSGGPVQSQDFTPTSAGTYRWIATYSGDANNNAVSGVCNDARETTVVSRTSPTINTTASANVKLGAGDLVDTATVSGVVSAQPGGTVTFNLYGPNDTTCANAPVATSIRPYPVAGGDVASLPYTPLAPGAYQWVAAYSGDANNNAVAGLCGEATEITAVAKATPAIATTASTNVAIGSPMTDTATVTGRVSPQASTIEFSLYGPNNATCSGSAIFTSFGVAYGPGATSVTSAPFTPTLPGTYRWVATYTGDVNNAAVTGTCGDPAETIQVFGNLSRIVTTASAGTFVGDGKALTDSATVLDRVNPDGTGIVDFRLYGPNDATCAGTPVFVSLNVAYPVAGGPVSSAGFVPTAAGTYRWVATYRGDTNNSTAVGVCGDSAETIQVAPTPSVDVVLPATGPGGVAGMATFGTALLLAGMALLGVSGRRRRFGNL